jgi:ABC-type transporter Mla MlaB component
MLTGSALLYITVDWIRQARRRDRLTPVLQNFADELRELADEYAG